MVRPHLNKKVDVKTKTKLLLPITEISSGLLITGLLFDPGTSGQMLTLKRMLASQKRHTPCLYGELKSVLKAWSSRKWNSEGDFISACDID